MVPLLPAQQDEQGQKHGALPVLKELFQQPAGGRPGGLIPHQQGRRLSRRWGGRRAWLSLLSLLGLRGLLSLLDLLCLGVVLVLLGRVVLLSRLGWARGA